MANEAKAAYLLANFSVLSQNEAVERTQAEPLKKPLYIHKAFLLFFT